LTIHPFIFPALPPSLLSFSRRRRRGREGDSGGGGGGGGGGEGREGGRGVVSTGGGTADVGFLGKGPSFLLLGEEGGGREGGKAEEEK